MSEKEKGETIDAESETKNLPASVKEQLAAISKDMDQQIGGMATKKISTNGKVFTLPNGDSNPGPLTVVILDFIYMNSYFVGAYDPKKPARPVCFAINRVIKQKDGTPVAAPSAAAPEPQGENCETCPKFQWKSGPNGKGKACKQQRRLIVCSPDAKTVEEVMTIYVSPKALTNFDGYMTKLVNAGFDSPLQITTDISFDPNQTYPLLQFKACQSHGNVQQMLKLYQEAQPILIKEPEVEAKAA